MSKIYNIFPNSFKLKVYNRDFIITSDLLGSRVEIHDGNKLISVLIKEGMVGHKFGEFVLTRKYGSKKNKSNKKK